MKKQRFLIDCDGVLADFCVACFDLIERHTGDRHTMAEVHHWDVFEALGKGHLKHLLTEEIVKGGWCLGFPVCPGALAGVKALQEIGDVVIVTAPMSTPCWAYERTVWLEQHFGIQKDEIIHTSGKKYVSGDVFIDDSDDNCSKWHAEHPRATTILWDAPYNVNAPIAGTGIRRAKNWADVIALVNHTKR